MREALDPTRQVNRTCCVASTRELPFWREDVVAGARWIQMTV